MISRKEPQYMATEDLRLALGEAYMDGTIDFEGRLEILLAMMAKNENIFCNTKILNITSKINSLINKKEQKSNIEHHYDLGNDFFHFGWIRP